MSSHRNHGLLIHRFIEQQRTPCRKCTCFLCY